MTTRTQLHADIAAAHKVVKAAEAALAEFEAKAENNLFLSLEEALPAVENILENRAHADCEGSHSVGYDEYYQEFMVGPCKYRATLCCEYNRHDKTYYYLDGSTFSYIPL